MFEPVPTGKHQFQTLWAAGSGKLVEILWSWDREVIHSTICLNIIQQRAPVLCDC